MMPSTTFLAVLAIFHFSVLIAANKGVMYLSEGEYGRLFVVHDGVAGTVCDDSFNAAAATVACKQMGFSGGILLKMISDFLGDHTVADDVPIWLDDIECDGEETSLTDCQHSDWGDHYCSHREDVYMECYLEGEDDTSAEITEVSLLGGTIKKEGIFILQTHRFTTYACISSAISQAAAEEACRTTGYGGNAYKLDLPELVDLMLDLYSQNFPAILQKLSANNWFYPFGVSSVSCPVETSSITDCQFELGTETSGMCVPAGIRCLQEYELPPSPPVVAGASLRGGRTEKEGILLLHINRFKTPVCEINQNAADLVCRTMGYRGHGYILREYQKTFEIIHSHDRIYPGGMNSFTCPAEASSTTECQFELNRKFRLPVDCQPTAIQCLEENDVPPIPVAERDEQNNAPDENRGTKNLLLKKTLKVLTQMRKKNANVAGWKEGQSSTKTEQKDTKKELLRLVKSILNNGRA